MKKAYIFSSPKCKACINLKKLLNEESISFVEIDKTLSQNKKLWNEISTQTDSIALPLLLIYDEDIGEGFAYLANRDWQSHQELIEIIKKNI